MKLKLDDDGHVVVVEGKPVFVYDDGKEIPFDAPATVSTITRLNGEAKTHREAKEAAEAKLKGFDGIEDPAVALKALQTVADIDSGQLLQAGKVEEIRSQAAKAADERIAAAQRESARQVEELSTTNKKLTGELYEEKVGGAFKGSKYLAEKVAVPADMIQAAFGHSFKIEDGAIVAYAKDGTKVFSRAKPGEIAGFDEALELLIEAYPFKDNILKGSGANGGGGNGGGNPGGTKSLTRSVFEGMPAADQMAHIKGGGAVTD